MITATFHEHAITVSGHSGCAPAGQDIICAAVSILMEAAAAVLRKEQAPVLDIRGKGLHMITASKDSGALETARQGLSLLAHHYAEYVQIRDLRARRVHHAR